MDLVVLKRKLHNLYFHPLNAYKKYVFGNVFGYLGKFRIKMLRVPYPAGGANYDVHWNYLSFERKVVLDWGAD